MSTPIGVAFIVLVCILLGSVAGIVLSRTLSERRFSDQTKDVVRMTAGTVGTMTALVLGLVLASERSAFDAEAAAVKQGAINIVVLDRMLSQYGPETTDVRKRIRQAVAHRYSLVWPEESWQPAQVNATEDVPVLESIQRDLVALAPKTEIQQWFKARALDASSQIFQSHWMSFSQRGMSVPMAFLVLLTFWLTIVFMSFGLFAPPNLVVAVTLLIGAFAVASSVFLIMELDDPFSGVVKVSGEPVAYSLSVLGK
jgi:hypothetical protein